MFLDIGIPVEECLSNGRSSRQDPGVGSERCFPHCDPGSPGQGRVTKVPLTFADVCVLHCLSFPPAQPLFVQFTFYILWSPATAVSPSEALPAPGGNHSGLSAIPPPRHPSPHTANGEWLSPRNLCASLKARFILGLQEVLLGCSVSSSPVALSFQKLFCGSLRI